MNPILSVVVPIYNVEKYLSKCIDSILKQTYENFEILLIDDGSTDSSSVIAQKYANQYEKVRYIRQKNKGLGGARNTGICQAKGQYVSFIDSDDYIESIMYETMMKKILEFHLDVCICDYQRVGETGNILEVHRESIPSNRVLNPRCQKDCILVDPSACNKIFAKSLFIDNDIYFPEKVWYEDIRTVTKILGIVESIYYLDIPFYQYLTRTTSIMNTPNLIRQKEIVFAMEDLLNFYRRNSLFSSFYEELKFLCVQHVYIYGINRIVRINSKSDLIDDLKQFVASNFPDFEKSQYFSKLSKKESFFYESIQKNAYYRILILDKAKKGLKKWKKY